MIDDIPSAPYIIKLKDGTQIGPVVLPNLNQERAILETLRQAGAIRADVAKVEKA